MAERRVTLLQLATDRVGTVRGAKVLAFMIVWEMAREAVGSEWPEGIGAQVRVYSEWWRQDVRTGWRELARFREAFPGESTPTRLMQAAKRARWDERRGVRGLGAVELRAA